MTYHITHTIEPWMPAGALKAKSDYAIIAVALGWHKLPLMRYNDARFSNETRLQKISEWLTDVKPKDLVLHQFPTYMSAEFERQFVHTLKHLNVCRAIVIHDIEPLRLVKQDAWEYQILNQYDFIIVHSKDMKNQLQANGVKAAFIVQPLFDYLSQPRPTALFSRNINFAGTFQKSPWLQNYTGPNLTLFGSKPKKWQNIDFSTHINYQGNFDPEEIVNHLTDGYGLIWDSDFDDKTYQTYTRYNTPHKASLYLRAGLPLIAWSQSAIGQFIVNHKLGFVINNLTDLNLKLHAINEAQYQLWQTNIQIIADHVGRGDYTKNTLLRLSAYQKDHYLSK
ncbi:sugar transferase [Leuconostoc gasicomitatum]|uniref:sugar transferase n=1 Tax=Leuconostoc gasicomitatum TaxID=115778 RepID=UPI000BDC1960|nr:sugar transferase [Leuconostoc gasicomitatum]MBZ5944370.1 sugar transferase [Leuconostoc gasicomitatum]MBZ5950421.1 sugar transferase [Leuconostoc gasicomitatum]MBZ5950865.1 sugar transferase [Leuconostoc gasicomitatum]MBZ5967642.1 sugar transferase [Leuconostoc gasicomitatum]MBZ5972286.1 sugar transferase [Leuconostoc gasicomitatum]